MEDLTDKFNQLSVNDKKAIKIIIVPKIILKKGSVISNDIKQPVQTIEKAPITLNSSEGLGENTEVLMFDGTSKLISEIKVGDLLMGPDSRARTVLSIYEGVGMLHEIIPNKGAHIFCTSNHKFVAIGIVPYIIRRYNRPKSYVVNYIENNLMTSKGFLTEEDAKKFIIEKSDNLLMDIKINKYLESTKNFKLRTYMYHCGLNFVDREIPIDPYMIGFWLGDGTSSSPEITNIDEECLDYFRNNLFQYGLELIKEPSREISYYIRPIGGIYSPGSNKFRNTLIDLNMLNNKHIPDIYKMNSREIRLKVLAGLIDSDGYQNDNCIEIIQKNKKLSDDIEFLCFSLGFMITRVECTKGCMYKGEMKYGIYQRMVIFGEGIEEIPVLLERKKCKKRGINKRATCHGFKVSNETVEDACFNIQVSDDHRFLLGDFTIMHDSSQ